MRIKILRPTKHSSAVTKNCVMTMGNFDGIHLGHQALIQQVVAKAKLLNVPSVVMTFEPHAFEFFSRGNVTIPRITRLREKLQYINELGVDYLCLLTFNQRLSQLSATAFVEHYLIDCLQPKQVILGDDFHFGYKRQGNSDLLKKMGKSAGFHVECMPSFCIAEQRTSSTLVRLALMNSDLAFAKRLLGRAYSMIGKIRKGDQLGRKLGYPTANIFLHRKLTPITGVFTVMVRGLSEGLRPGVASLGIRPTVGGTKALLEVHLLDFDEDIYGQEVEVFFCKRLRPEIRFNNLDELTAHIAEDVAVARHYFEEMKHDRL